jgi:flagellar biosynthesis anti-sigma factor FlgM
MVQSIRPQDASGVYRRNLAGAAAVEGASTHRAANGSGTRTRRTDSVALSNEAVLLARSLQAAQGAPEVRDALVAHLRASVQDGTYRVDAQRIAGQLLAATREHEGGAGDADSTTGAQA